MIKSGQFWHVLFIDGWTFSVWLDIWKRYADPRVIISGWQMPSIASIHSDKYGVPYLNADNGKGALVEIHSSFSIQKGHIVIDELYTTRTVCYDRSLYFEMGKYTTRFPYFPGLCVPANCKKLKQSPAFSNLEEGEEVNFHHTRIHYEYP